jgi:L-malate glycosyltransferase
MKIAMVSDAIYPYNKGGKEKRIFEVSTRLAQKGHEVTIYCMKWWKGKENTITENGVSLHAISPLYPLYSGERRSIKQAILFAFSCFKLLKADFDIIEADHMPHLVLFSLKIVALLKRKKLFVTWSEVWGRKYWVKYMGLFGNIASIIEWLSVKLPVKIIAVSEHTKTKLVNELKVKTDIKVVPNGINFLEIQNVKPAETQSDIIFAGRLLKHKNVDILINAVKILSKEKTDINCLIIGEGPEKKKLINLVEELGLKNIIQFLDFLPRHADLYALIKSSRVFVLPSTREGFGIVVLEANACGIPVITINNRDNASKDLINKENGLLINLSDHELASAIKELLGKKDNSNCISFAKKYDWDGIADQAEKIFLQEKSIIVTTSWDDGHKLDLKLINLLRKYNVPATFYVSPFNCEFNQKELLTTEDVRNISKDFEIGAHTMTHPHLPKISLENAKKEILESKKYLEKIINKKVTAFCYPYGEYNTNIKNSVKCSGFRIARTTGRFSINTGTDRFETPTTVHAYSHLLDLKNLGMLLKYRTVDWESLAKKQFKDVLRNGGVFHLWGHSWEIEKFNYWKKLENILSLIGNNKKNVKYMSNSCLIK